MLSYGSWWITSMFGKYHLVDLDMVCNPSMFGGLYVKDHI